MSLRECIIKAAKANIINETKKEELLKQFDDNLEEFSKTLSRLDAERAASQKTFRDAKRKTKQKAIENTIQVIKQKELVNTLENYKNAKGEIDMAEGFAALHGKTENPTMLNNLEIRQRDIYSDYTKKISDLIIHYKNPLIKKWKKATPDNLVRELYVPGSTGNKGAEMMAKSMSEVFEMGRANLVKNGVLVAKDPNWHLPQSHNSKAILKLKEGEWVDLIENYLAPEKMIDNETGKTFDLLPREKFRAALVEAEKNILKDAAVAGKATGLKKFQQHRFLIFKDADSFLEYNKKLGTEIIPGIYQHLDMMARAIAETEIFGPKPTSTRNYLKKFLIDKADPRLKRKDILAKFGRDEIKRTEEKIKRADVLYDYFVGKGFAVQNEMIGRFFANSRHFVTGTLLGAAGPTVLIGDLATTAANAYMRGLSPLKAIQRSLAEQFKGKKAAKEAMYLKLIVDDLIENNMIIHRFVDEMDTAGLAQAYSTGMLRAGGIVRFTQQARNGVGKFFLSDEGIGGYTQYSYVDIDIKSKGSFSNKFGRFKRMLDTYQITKEEWDVIRTTQKYIPEEWIKANDLTEVSIKGKLAFVDPGAIAARTDIDERLALSASKKLMNMVLTEQDHMVIVNSNRASTVAAGLKRGNVAHELGFSGLMFKTFGINALLFNLMRAYQVPPTGMGKAKHTIALLGAMTITGATTLLIKDILRGEDPRRILETKFFFQSILAGGALGPYGDLLANAPDKRSFGLLASGPVVSLIADTAGLIYKGGEALYNELFTGEKINYGGTVSKYVRDWSPLKFWYTKLLLQRYFYDQLSLMLDDDHYKKKRRRRRYLREKGSDYWWRPDELLPERPPQLTE